MQITRIPAEGYGANCWLLINNAGESIIIDPSADIADVKRAYASRELDIRKLKFIILTHGHFDHIIGLRELKSETGAKVCVHAEDAECLTDSNKNLYMYFFREDITFDEADVILTDGDEITLCDIKLKVIHTPGHTKGSSCFYTGEVLFSGDTLFDRSIGRTDLYGGSFGQLNESLKKLKQLPPEVTVYPGHGSITTIEKQIKFNQYLNNL